MPSTKLNCHTAITINQPIDKVWDTINDFHDLSWCPNVVSSCDALGDIPGDKTGAVRVFNENIQEILKERNDDDHVIRYAVEKGPAPISEVFGFVGEIKLNPVMDGVTQVQWSANWNANNRDAIKFCTETYVAMLEDLRETMKNAE